LLNQRTERAPNGRSRTKGGYPKGRLGAKKKKTGRTKKKEREMTS